jgi:hypothetical protein
MVTALQGTIAGLQTALTGLTSQVQVATASGTANTTSIAGIVARLDTLQANLSKWTAENSAAQVSIASLATDANSFKASVISLNTDIQALKADVATIKSERAGAGATIGMASVNINGVDVAFLLNNVHLSPADPVTPGVAQLAVRITNGTSRSLIGVDIIGSVLLSTSLLGGIKTGYPTLVDGVAAYAYNAYYNGSNAINFEVFSVGGKDITIPKQSSITLRPRVTFLAAAGSLIPAMNLTISLSTISYDLGP